jgi:hypothetical protein
MARKKSVTEKGEVFGRARTHIKITLDEGSHAVFFIYYFQMRQRRPPYDVDVSCCAAAFTILYTHSTHSLLFLLSRQLFYVRTFVCDATARRTPAQVASVCSKSGRGFVLFSCVCMRPESKKGGKTGSSIINIKCTLLSIYAPQRGVRSLQRSKSPRLHIRIQQHHRDTYKQNRCKLCLLSLKTLVH